MRTLFTIACAILIVSMSSCSLVYGRILLGMKKAKEVSDQKVIEILAANHSIGDSYYRADSAFALFLSSLNANDVVSRSIKEKYIQPLNAVVFDAANGGPYAWIANCHGAPKGLRNLTWQIDNQLKESPFQVNNLNDRDTLRLPALFSLLDPVRKSSAWELAKITDYDYVAVIFWADFMGRQNENFLQEIHENFRKSESKIKVLYVNMDGLFAKYGSVEYK